MESQIWCKSEQKWAYILMLRGHEVHILKVTGMSFTLKRKVQEIIQMLQQGEGPADIGAGSIQTLDARLIGKAEVAPGNGSLKLQGEAEGAKALSFTTADNNADEILKAILAQSGRAYQPTQEEIGVGEALLPPLIFGAFGGALDGGLPVRR